MFAWDTGATLLAPLVAIVMALVTRRVLPSLAVGVVMAGVVAREGRIGPVDCLFPAFLEGEAAPEGGMVCAVAGYLGGAVLDGDDTTIVLFTLFVAMMVGVMSVSGATRRLVAAVERVAKGSRGSMIASWLAGFVVFFDDYANCLVVGSSMGPVCDRNGVSRAKLAYIVDSTAAPVASLALVGTWVGYEVGLLDQALEAAGQGAGGGFELFLTALPYRFYGVFALALVGIVAFTGLDWGPMLGAERTARAAARHPAAADHDHRDGNLLLAALPIVVLVAITFGYMVIDGIEALQVPVADAAFYEILGGADAYAAMWWGGMMGLCVATLGAAMQATPFTQIGSGARDGALSVLQGIAILYLAWTLGNAIGDTEARTFLTSSLGTWLAPWSLPAAVFVLASLIAFATGTSFGTMSILLPLVVPLAVDLGGDAVGIVAGATAAVLAGASLGDHASPISDTTVLSATGSSCELVEHVRTQLPYALLAGVVSLIVGYVPAGLGASPWLLLPIGIALLFGVHRFLGEDPGAEVAEAA